VSARVRQRKIPPGEIMSSADHLLALFDESRFLPALAARSRSAALQQFADAFAEDKEIRHPAVIFDALEAREQLGSTGIGKEVAIPHSRTVSVPALKVLLARAPHGIEWSAADEKPVKLLFAVVAPPVERVVLYLPLLGAIVGAMQKKKHRDALMSADGWDDVKTALEEAFRG
jgi:mannitol/fructose-specific phosphotransferase system IIA component (Ntr-type)